MAQSEHAAMFHMSRSFQVRSHPDAVYLMERLGRIKRTDGDVVPVRISKRKLRGSSAGIHVWLFFQPAYKSARPWQSYIKVVDPKE